MNLLVILRLNDGLCPVPSFLKDKYDVSETRVDTLLCFLSAYYVFRFKQMGIENGNDLPNHLITETFIKFFKHLFSGSVSLL